VSEHRSNLFSEAMAKNNDMDYPLCVECADWLLEMLEKKCASAEKEHQVYSNLVRGNESMPITLGSELEEVHQFLPFLRCVCLLGYNADKS
jgi:hypothetical protein